jgi:regulator of replication initiation timing
MGGNMERIEMLEESLREMIDHVEKLQKENDRLREKLQEEEGYQEYLKRHRIKGQCAGYIVMGISDVIERGARDHALKTQAALRKLMNNPALSDKVKNTLADAHSLISSELFWRRQAEIWREKAKDR